MRTIANQHFLHEKEEHPESPSHWSIPAEELMTQQVNLTKSWIEAIKRAPHSLRTLLESVRMEVVRLQHMVSDGVILGLVRREFHEEYAKVHFQAEEMVKILTVLKHVARTNHEILCELCRQTGRPVPLSLDEQLDEAFKHAREALSEVA